MRTGVDDEVLSYLKPKGNYICRIGYFGNVGVVILPNVKVGVGVLPDPKMKPITIWSKVLPFEPPMMG